MVFNTCAVTGEAVRQARQAIRKARRARPGARLIVTGCAAQIDPAAFAAMDEIDLVLGNAEKTAPGALSDTGARVRVNDIMSVRETAGHLIDGLRGRARAYVEVQNGCDHRCTFCVIPYGRGNSRSAAAGEVVEQIRRLTGEGYGEIVLTGVDITSWGSDLPGQPSLGQLVARILKLVPGLPRLRLSSIDAAEIDPDLMRCLAEEPRLMLLPAPVLAVRRRHDPQAHEAPPFGRADALSLIDRVRSVRPDVAFGADLIAGFPTETEAMFDNTLALVDEADLAFLHVFPFSPRPGTPGRPHAAVAKAGGQGRARRACARPAMPRTASPSGRPGRPHRAGLVERRRAWRGRRISPRSPSKGPGRLAGSAQIGVRLRVTGRERPHAIAGCAQAFSRSLLRRERHASDYVATAEIAGRVMRTTTPRSPPGDRLLPAPRSRHDRMALSQA